MALNILLRTITFLLSLILIAFALLQLNDPDPIPWISFYLVCSLVPLLLTFRIYNQAFFWLTIALSVIAMGIYASGVLEYLQHVSEEALMQSMNPKKPYIEEAREFIGGFITFCFLMVCQLIRKKIIPR